jgi:hypothetical protein
LSSTKHQFLSQQPLRRQFPHRLMPLDNFIRFGWVEQPVSKSLDS